MGETKPESGFFRNAPALCGGIVATIGALGLLGWISGLRVLVFIDPNYIPMSPDTAGVFVVFGSLLWIDVRSQVSNRYRTFVTIIVAVASAYGLLKFIEYFVRLDLTFENILFPITETVGAFPIRRMSPITGSLFLFAGVALLLTLWNGTHPRSRNLVGGLGILVFLAGFVATTGYLFGTPLLYGGDMIPLAATTAIAFLLLGTGLTAAAGPANVFVRPLVGPSVRARMLRAFLPLTAIIVLVEGFLRERLADTSEINHALLSAAFSLVFIAITAAAVTRVAQVISRAIDIAEAERKRAEEQLAYQAHLLEHVDDAIVASDAQFRLTAWNAAAERTYGWKAQEALGRDGLDIVQTEFPEAERMEMLRTIQEKGYYRGEATQVRRDGSRFPVEVSSIVLHDAAGRVTGYVSVNRDITERKQIEEEIQNLARFPGENPNPILRVSREGVILYANRTSQAWLETWNTYIGSRVPSAWQGIILRVLETGKLEEIEMGIGTQVFVAIFTPFADSGYVNVYGHNITERKQAEAKLQYLSMHDMLTGLYNRTFFEEELARWEHSRQFPFSIVVADINRLKQTNDREGHAAGDELLRQAAQVLKTAFRAEDVVARIGGDEFAILLPSADAAAAEQALARVRRFLAAHNAQGRALPMGFALGTATANGHGSLTSVLKDADQRMYEDKSAQLSSESKSDS